MTLLNFSHPLTPAQLLAIQSLTGGKVKQVIDVKTQFDNTQPFTEQASKVVESISLSPEQWQTSALLINLPSLSAIAALVLAELHGRCGYFPAILRLRPVANTTPLAVEVAEILNLQSVRDGARHRR